MAAVRPDADEPVPALDSDRSTLDAIMLLTNSLNVTEKSSGDVRAGDEVVAVSAVMVGPVLSVVHAVRQHDTVC